MTESSKSTNRSSEVSKPLIATTMFLAGLLSLGLTLYGCVLVLGLPVPPPTWTDGLLEVSLLGGFPAFLLTFWSLRTGAVALWIYFLANWCAWCLCSVPPRFFFPIDVYSFLVLTPAVLVSISLLLRGPTEGSQINI